MLWKRSNVTEVSTNCLARIVFLVAAHLLLDQLWKPPEVAIDVAASSEDIITGSCSAMPRFRSCKTAAPMYLPKRALLSNLKISS